MSPHSCGPQWWGRAARMQDRLFFAPSVLSQSYRAEQLRLGIDSAGRRYNVMLRVPNRIYFFAPRSQFQLRLPMYRTLLFYSCRQDVFQRRLWEVERRQFRARPLSQQDLQRGIRGWAQGSLHRASTGATIFISRIKISSFSCKTACGFNGRAHIWYIHIIMWTFSLCQE